MTHCTTSFTLFECNDPCLFVQDSLSLSLSLSIWCALFYFYFYSFSSSWFDNVKLSKTICHLRTPVTRGFSEKYQYNNMRYRSGGEKQARKYSASNKRTIIAQKTNLTHAFIFMSASLIVDFDNTVTLFSKK